MRRNLYVKSIDVLSGQCFIVEDWQVIKLFVGLYIHLIVSKTIYLVELLAVVKVQYNFTSMANEKLNTGTAQSRTV